MDFVVTSDCPRCEAPIRVVRNGVTAEKFFGCSKYPSCRWTQSYDEVVSKMARDFAASVGRADEQAKEILLDAEEQAGEILLEAEERAEKILAEARLVAATKSPGSGSLAAINKALLDMVFEYHPDRNHGGLDATKVVAKLNVLRDLIKKERG